ncbi:hypothetical protein PHMEG_000839 [Phytophthora megakarya]|uniref:Elicitin n=1 Tax=Phytophthora megakarya TaxID=4795 RepID=A0A225X2N9_9STRA|nr:hypothetical protein PHMEG_000839 [Phytophthora megakarya]
MASVLVHLSLLLVFFAVADASNATESSDDGLVYYYDIPECSDDELNLGEAILTTEPNTLRCEELFRLRTGMLLQSADVADLMCGEQICLNALRILLSTLPNCRYERWGLKYSAAKFLNHCGVATNVTGLA